MKYPSGVDCVWLAFDRNRHVAAFVTAGVGPIPEAVLGVSLLPIDEPEERVRALRRMSEARLLCDVKRPDDFVELAERGLFVYDWTDAHRTARGATHEYEGVAAPVTPIVVEGIVDHQLATAIVELPAVDFATTPSLAIMAHLTCRGPG